MAVLAIEITKTTIQKSYIKFALAADRANRTAFKLCVCERLRMRNYDFELIC